MHIVFKLKTNKEALESERKQKSIVKVYKSNLVFYTKIPTNKQEGFAAKLYIWGIDVKYTRFGWGEIKGNSIINEPK